VLVDDRKCPDPRLHHGARGFAKRCIGAGYAWSLRHEVADGELVLQLDVGKSRKSRDGLPVRLLENVFDHIVPSERPSHATDELQVTRCKSGRGNDEGNDVRSLRLAIPQSPLDRFGRCADGNANSSRRVRSVVQYESAVAERNKVLAAVLADPLQQTLGVREKSGPGQPVRENG
jgi:hypothetical protein